MQLRPGPDPSRSEGCADQFSISLLGTSDPAVAATVGFFWGGANLAMWRSRSVREKILILLFLLSLPFIRARVSWDGIGYYAYLRSPLIDHNLQFAGDWHDRPITDLLKCKACSSQVKSYWSNPANRLLVVFLNNHFYANPITKTGHLPNFYTVGPAILWAPFIATTHLAVTAADGLGAHIMADGHSWPYIVTLCGATALYGFLGLYLSFLLAKKYLGERWAFWATLGIWFASSLPVYMYLDPSWSHAHSAFTVALFLWYWDRTRTARTTKQWVVLGLIGGLMIDVYLANCVFFLAPAAECLLDYWRFHRDAAQLWKSFRTHLVFSLSVIAAFSPMLITREIVYGNPFALGMYTQVSWNWRSPKFWSVLFSRGHGLFVWTPILLIATVGLFSLWRKEPWLARTAIASLIAFYCLISFDPWWYGTLSFGNRFFVSMTPIFVLGLAAAFAALARLWPEPSMAVRRLAPVVVMLILWNLGLMFQWSTHMILTPGYVSWDVVAYDQVHVVPGRLLDGVIAKFVHKPVNQQEARDAVQVDPL